MVRKRKVFVGTDSRVCVEVVVQVRTSGKIERVEADVRREIAREIGLGFADAEVVSVEAWTR